MRVALTGATGFIGRHVAAHLVARGDEVRAIVRPTSLREAPPGIHVFRAQLDPRSLVEALTGVDAVVHLAGVVSTTRDDVYRAVNVGGTRAVAEATAAAGARLIHISSLAAAGPAPPTKPRLEDDPPDPVNAYGRSKLDGERIVRSLGGLRWTILRPGVVYGPGDRAMLPLFRLAARGVLPMVGRRDAAYTLLHVDDLVRTVEAALNRSADSEVMFVGHPRPVSTVEILEQVRSAVGGGAVIVPVPRLLTWTLAALGDIAGRLSGRPMPLNRRRYVELYASGFACRVDRLRERLGVVAQIDLPEGFADAALWYRTSGRI